jgi:RNA polymerase sigma factor (TIGR02999 family)
MTAGRQPDLTEILIALRAGDIGDKTATNELFRLVYDELRHLAINLMRAERTDHTLQPTALVHEAYCRLVDQKRVGWQNRAHFFGIAARAMRQILVDHARQRAARKRGGDKKRVTFRDSSKLAVSPQIEVLELDEALAKLGKKDGRMAEVVQLHVFGGLRFREIAHVLGVSRNTAQNDWRVARMWLNRELVGRNHS